MHRSTNIRQEGETPDSEGANSGTGSTLEIVGRKGGKQIRKEKTSKRIPAQAPGTIRNGSGGKSGGVRARGEKAGKVDEDSQEIISKTRGVKRSPVGRNLSPESTVA